MCLIVVYIYSIKAHFFINYSMIKIRPNKSGFICMKKKITLNRNLSCMSPFMEIVDQNEQRTRNCKSRCTAE